MAVGGLACWYAALIREEAHLIQEVATLDREQTVLRATLGRTLSAREAASDLGRRTQAIDELTSRQGTVLRILDSLLDLVPPDLWLTAVEARSPELRMAGSARSARAVADFTANLRASGAFRDVEIVASRQDLVKVPPGPLGFEITCRVAP